MFESLIGAVFIDAGIPAVEELLSRFIEPAVNSILLEQKDQDPKSRLQEWAQAQAYGPPTYQVVSTTGPDHARIFEVVVMVNTEVYGTGSGSSKQAATKRAAANALKSLGLHE
jgi:ribonuclease-3